MAPPTIRLKEFSVEGLRTKQILSSSPEKLLPLSPNTGNTHEARQCGSKEGDKPSSFRQVR